jgi:hypothetical protein
VVTKHCRICGEVKPFTEFHRASGTRDGYRGECKSCFRTQQNARYAADPTPSIERVKAWQKANPDKVRASKDRRKADGRTRLTNRKSHLMRKYGLTLGQYEAMLEAQGGVCAICGRPPRDDISLHVDHDHVSGALRGLLCFLCNNSVGDLAEDPERARALARYLDDHDAEMVELAAVVKDRVQSLTG